MISFDNVTKTYLRADGTSVTPADGISLSIQPGEFVCLVGPSGCGKTTLLQMLAGLVEPTSGAISVDGRAIERPGPDRGVVFQKDSVFPWMRVIENVEYGPKCRGVPAATRRQTAQHYLAEVGLADVEQSWPRELSGGMLKRVAVAAVFANDSDILLLDEPFGALDYVTRLQLQALLLRLWSEARERRRTVLFVTHDVEEALLLADRILVFRQGRAVDDIAVSAERPRHIETLSQPEMVNHRKVLLEHLGLGNLA